MVAADFARRVELPCFGAEAGTGGGRIRREGGGGRSRGGGEECGEQLVALGGVGLGELGGLDAGGRGALQQIIPTITEKERKVGGEWSPLQRRGDATQLNQATKHGHT